MFKYQELNNSNCYALPEELEYLRHEAFKLNAQQQIVMLGAGPCVFGLAMAEARPDRDYPFMSIIDIDPCHYCIAHLDMVDVPMWSYETIQADSSEVGYAWEGWVDLLVIDADHSYDGVKRDIRAWWPVVKKGGLVFFHDYLARPDGFNGDGEWLPSEVAEAIERVRDSGWVFVKQVGISIVYMKVEDGRAYLRNTDNV